MIIRSLRPTRLSILLVIAGAAVYAQPIPAQDQAPEPAKPEAKGPARPRAGDKVEIQRGSFWRPGTVQLMQADGIVIKWSQSGKTEKKAWSEVRWPGSTETFETLQPGYKAPAADDAGPQAPAPGTARDSKKKADLGPLTKPKAGDKVEVFDDPWWNDAVIQLIHPDGITVKDKWNKTAKKPWSQVRKPGDPRTFESLAPNYKAITLDDVPPGSKLQYAFGPSWHDCTLVALLADSIIIQADNDLKEKPWDQVRRAGSTIPLSELQSSFKPAPPCYDTSAPDAPKIGDPIEVLWVNDSWHKGTLLAVQKTAILIKWSSGIETKPWTDVRLPGQTKNFRQTLVVIKDPNDKSPAYDPKYLPNGYQIGDNAQYLFGSSLWLNGTITAFNEDKITVKKEGHGTLEELSWSKVRSPKTLQTFEDMRAGVPGIATYPKGQAITYKFGSSTYNGTVEEDLGDYVSVLQQGQSVASRVSRKDITTPPAPPAVIPGLVPVSSTAQTSVISEFKGSATFNPGLDAVISLPKDNKIKIPVPQGDFGPGKLFVSPLLPVVAVAFAAEDGSQVQLVRVDTSGPEAPLTFPLAGAQRVVDFGLDGQRVVSESKGVLTVWALKSGAPVKLGVIEPFGRDTVFSQTDQAYLIGKNNLLLVSPKAKMIRYIDTAKMEIVWSYTSSYNFGFQINPQRTTFACTDWAKWTSFVDIASAGKITSINDAGNIAFSPTGTRAITVNSQMGLKIVDLAAKGATTPLPRQQGVEGKIQWVDPLYFLVADKYLVNAQTGQAFWIFSSAQACTFAQPSTAWRIRNDAAGNTTVLCDNIITPAIQAAAKSANLQAARELQPGTPIDIQINIPGAPAGLAESTRKSLETQITNAKMKPGPGSPFKIVCSTTEKPAVQHKLQSMMNRTEPETVSVTPVVHNMTFYKGAQALYSRESGFGEVIIGVSRKPNQSIPDAVSDAKLESFKFYLNVNAPFDILKPLDEAQTPSGLMFP